MNGITTAEPRPSTKRTQRDRRVLDVLARCRHGLSLNDVAEACGGPTSESSRALMDLESEGRVRLVGARWSLAQPHGVAGIDAAVRQALQRARNGAPVRRAEAVAPASAA